MNRQVKMKENQWPNFGRQRRMKVEATHFYSGKDVEAHFQWGKWIIEWFSLIPFLWTSVNKLKILGSPQNGNPNPNSSQNPHEDLGSGGILEHIQNAPKYYFQKSAEHLSHQAQEAAGSGSGVEADLVIFHWSSGRSKEEMENCLNRLKENAFFMVHHPPGEAWGGTTFYSGVCSERLPSSLTRRLQNLLWAIRCASKFFLYRKKECACPDPDSDPELKLTPEIVIDVSNSCGFGWLEELE
jgi:hypothetical protein